jgi:hypothetical protein
VLWLLSLLLLLSCTVGFGQPPDDAYQVNQSIRALDPLGGQWFESACDAEPVWDGSPTRELASFVGYDAWRAHPDGAWGNYGIHTGINWGSALGQISELTGIGLQVGASIGIYNWAGTDYRFAHQDRATTQGFVTYGLFRRATLESSWNATVVHDWMINNNYSVFGEDSTLGQVRTQLGYILDEQHELGIWGAWRVMSDTREVGPFGPVTWRPINQLNAYWHHKWGYNGAHGWVWIGVPEQDRLTGGGSLGDWIAGAYAICPLGDRVSLYSMVNYMHQSASPGPDASRDDAWNIFTGLSFHFGGRARAATIRGNRWMPQLPVANNGLMLVDASQTF